MDPLAASLFCITFGVLVTVVVNGVLLLVKKDKNE